jgi:DNA-binding NarL/FixJ family response regulator
MISVVLVDDHPLVLEGLRAILAAAPDIEVTGEARDGPRNRASGLINDGTQAGVATMEMPELVGQYCAEL